MKGTVAVLRGSLHVDINPFRLAVSIFLGVAFQHEDIGDMLFIPLVEGE